MDTPSSIATLVGGNEKVWPCLPQKTHRMERFPSPLKDGNCSTVATKRKKVGFVMACSRMPDQPPTVPFSFRIGLLPIGSRQLIYADEP